MAEESKSSMEDSISTQTSEEEELSFPQTTEERETHEVLTKEVLESTAKDFANYLVINDRRDKKQLDERIQSIVFRVEEFQRQLEWMHQNVTSTSEKVSDIHVQVQAFKELYSKIDQIEAFIGIVTSQVDLLEETVSRAEKELGQNKIRKVFSVFPGVRKPQKRDSLEPWKRPEVFSAREYFTPRIRALEQMADTDQTLRLTEDD